jgi:hypothetical protein
MNGTHEVSILSVFFRLLEQKLGIIPVIPTHNTVQLNTTRSTTLTISKTITETSEFTEREDESDTGVRENPPSQEDLQFSPQSKKLFEMKKCAHFKPTKKFLLEYVQQLYLFRENITTIGEDTPNFNHLEELSLSMNNIIVIENLPRNLKVLNCYGNR